MGMIRSSGSRRRRSSGSLVITESSANLEQTTTDASTTSLTPLRPHKTPAARAPASSSGTTATFCRPRKRASRACRGVPRHACASTPDGTLNVAPTAQASSSRACMHRAPRSIPIKAPVSSVRLEAISGEPEGFTRPAPVIFVRWSGLSRHIGEQGLKIVEARLVGNRRGDEGGDRAGPTLGHSPTRCVDQFVRQAHCNLRSHTRIIPISD